MSIRLSNTGTKPLPNSGEKAEIKAILDLENVPNVDATDCDNHTNGTEHKVFTATEQTKLEGVETNATADQSGAEIKAAYEAEDDTNAFTDAEKASLANLDTKLTNTLNGSQPFTQARFGASGPTITAGTGVPSLDLPVPSIYLRTDASSPANDFVYVKNTTGANGWGVLSLAPGPETHVFVSAGQSNRIGWVPNDGGAGFPTGTQQYNQSEVLEDISGAYLLDHVNSRDPGDMGPDVQFAIAYKASNPNVDIVFVPCGLGGSSFSANQWGVGNPLYTDLVFRTNQLFTENPSFILKGLLWHQGETDVGFATYEQELDAMFNAFRVDVDRANAATPIVLGQFLPFWVADDLPARANHEAIITDTPNRINNTAVADASGLTNEDAAHFDAASLRTFGIRYKNAFDVASISTVLTAPQSLTATAGDASISLSWSAPSSDGGSAITDYQIERSTDGTNFSVIADGVSTATTYNDTGLTNGQEYTYRVSAINSIETGPASNTSAATPAALTVPTAPQSLTATAGNASAALSWSAPSSNGGAAITDYQIERSTDGTNFSVITDVVSTATTYDDTGLTNGQEYTYRVSAINSEGTGPVSNTDAATPAASSIPQDMYMHITFDNGLTDEMGNITTAAFMGSSAVVSDGTRGNVLSMPDASGTNGGVSLGASYSIGNSGYTKSAWINVTSLNSYNNILAAAIDLDSTTAVFTIGNGNLLGYTGSSIPNHGSAAYSVTNGQWAHVVTTYDATSGVAAIYLNGSQVATGSPGTGINITAPEIIGGYKATGNRLYGFIDDVRVWQRPLTGQEVSDLYAETLI